MIQPDWLCDHACVFLPLLLVSLYTIIELNFKINDCCKEIYTKKNKTRKKCIKAFTGIRMGGFLFFFAQFSLQYILI